MLEITVHEIRGKCPMYEAGDKLVIEGSRVLLERTDAVCVHALPAILHYATSLERGVDPLSLGLTKKESS